MSVDPHIVVDGQFVSARIERIVLAIKEYEPRIDVQWIPPTARTHEGQAAFKIVYNEAGLPEYTIMHVQSEDDFDERVLLKIIANDQRNGEVTMSELDAFEATQKLMAEQIHLDKMEEAADITKHIVRSHLNTYKVNDQLTIKDGIPFNAKNL